MSKFEIRSYIQETVAIFGLLFLGLDCFGQEIKQVKVLRSNDFTNQDNTVLIDFKKPFTLPYHQNNIQIIFENPDSLITQLSPLESSGFVNRSTSVYYNNLEGGKYVFNLKNPQKQRVIGAVFFEVELPFYKTWWFVLLILFYIVFVISIVIYIFFNYRFRQQTKIQRVRDNIAADLHDDVGATLSSIGFFGEMIRAKILKNAPTNEVLLLLDRLISTSKETIETMRGVIWTINPSNDDAVDFFQKLRSFGQEMLAAKSIVLHFEVQGFDTLKLSLDSQRNLFLFYKEAINNIAKHSEASEVNIKWIMQNEKCRLEISDNGKGFDTTEMYEGHGLKGFHKRAIELNGHLDITSSATDGTSIKLIYHIP